MMNFMKKWSDLLREMINDLLTILVNQQRFNVSVVNSKSENLRLCPSEKEKKPHEPPNLFAHWNLFL